MSALEARVRIREGLSRLVAEGLPLGGPEARRTANLLLDCCGSDHRPLVDLVLFAAAQVTLPAGPAMPAVAWPAQREALVAGLTARTFLEPDAARWAVETLAWAHQRITDDALAPVRPFTSTALPAPPPAPVTRAAAPLPPARPAPMGARLAPSPQAPRTLVPAGAPLAAPLASRLLGPARPLPFGATLRFGQPWYAVQGGALPIALPTRRAGPRRPPPIAPISGRLVFAGWTRQTWSVAGALGAATLLLAVGYWTILNAARESSYRSAVSHAAARLPTAASAVRLEPPARPTPAAPAGAAR